MVLERLQVLRETYRQLFRGDRYNVWGVQTDWVFSRPEYPAEPPQFGSDVEMYVVSPIDGSFREGEPVGDRALPVMCEFTSPVQLNYCESAVHRFHSDGTGITENVGSKIDANGRPAMAQGSEPLLWSTSRTGPLQINYPGYSATYWRIEQTNEAVSTLVYVARAQDGGVAVTRAGLAPMINADLPGDFSDLGLVGTWDYGSLQFRAAYGYDPDEPPFASVIERRVDGTMARKDTDYYDDPPSQITIRYGWQMSGENLYETRYRANVTTGIPGTLGFADCQSAYARGATQCAPQQVRYFRPLARVGNRLYGLQEVYSQFSNIPPYLWSRGVTPTYYEKH
jgi:hypothetical protein